MEFTCCQRCGGEYPDKNMDYETYLQHLTKECPRIKFACPFKCGIEKGSTEQTGNKFEKHQLRDHLASQYCPNFHVYCNDCGAKVLVKDKINHICAIKKLYERVKGKVL